MRRIGWMGHVTLCCGLLVLFCSCGVQAQPQPVSRLAMDGVVGKVVDGELFSLKKTSPRNSQSGRRLVTTGFIEVPFGVPELQFNRIVIQNQGTRHSAEIGVSQSGFDELNQVAGWVSWSFPLTRLQTLDLQIGGYLSVMGVLKRHISPFWRLGTIRKLSERSAVFAEIGRSAEEESGYVSISTYLVGTVIRITRRVGIISHLESSSERDFSLPVVVRYRPVDAVWMGVGVESSRSLFFGEVGITTKYISATLFSSYHPILSRTFGTSIHLSFN